jgi:hydroxymethylglutaryl-CoA reductase
MESEESGVFSEESTNLMVVVMDLRNSINEFRDSVIVYVKDKEQQRIDSTWLSTEEAIEFLQVSQKTLYRYRIQNIIEHKKVGKNWYYRFIGKTGMHF